MKVKRFSMTGAMYTFAGLLAIVAVGAAIGLAFYFGLFNFAGGDYVSVEVEVVSVIPLEKKADDTSKGETWVVGVKYEVDGVRFNRNFNKSTETNDKPFEVSDKIIIEHHKSDPGRIKYTGE